MIKNVQKHLQKNIKKVTKNVYKVLKNTQKTIRRIAGNMTAVRQFLRQTTRGALAHPAFPPSSRGLTARERAHRQDNLAGKQGERRSVYVNYCFSNFESLSVFFLYLDVFRKFLQKFSSLYISLATVLPCSRTANFEI